MTERLTVDGVIGLAEDTYEAVARTEAGWKDVPTLVQWQDDAPTCISSHSLHAVGINNEAFRDHIDGDMTFAGEFSMISLRVIAPEGVNIVEDKVPHFSEDRRDKRTEKKCKGYQPSSEHGIPAQSSAIVVPLPNKYAFIFAIDLQYNIGGERNCKVTLTFGDMRMGVKQTAANGPLTGL